MKSQQQKLAAAAGTILVAEPVMQLAHFGGPGVIVGLAAGALAYLVADEIQQAKQDAEGDNTSPAPAASPEQKPLAGARSFAYRLVNGKSTRRGEAEETEEKQPAPLNGLPRRSPTFAEMKHLIKSNRVILGYDGQKFISGEAFSQVVNIAIIGLPRHGKTTCLRFHMAQGLMHGAIIRGWDTHGDVAGEFADFLSIAETVPAILADCQWIDQELERRAALFKRYRKHDAQAEREWPRTRPLVYIIDELFLLLTVHIKTKAERDVVTSTLLNLIAGASKYKCRLVLSGQALPATVFGDQASSVRDIIDTRYAFASEDRQARMIGIDEKAIKEQMPLIAGDDIRGYSILAGGPLVTNRILSIPDTTFQDIRVLMAEDDDTEFDEEEDDEESEELPEGITELDLEQIIEAYEAGWRLRDIVALVQMDLKTFKVACDLVGIDVTTPTTRPQRAVPPVAAEQQPAPLKLMPKAGPRRATYDDAIAVWNKIGEPIGRPRLKKELENLGLECSDDLAKQLLTRINDALRKQAEEAGGGVAVGGGED
ncbi:MAG TPA: hypothetical protein VFV38_08735 [Ktedonobacteraceae bacterium]|nr:hypothetical protein [Ktedonobacteraceae bacterium]